MTLPACMPVTYIGAQWQVLIWASSLIFFFFFSFLTLKNRAFSGYSGSVRAQDRPQLPQLSPVFQIPNWPHRAVSLRYWQSDNTTSAAVLPHLRATQKGNVAKGIWPDHTPIAHKLYGSFGDQRCTATFIKETGVSIWRTRRSRRILQCPPLLCLVKASVDK